MWSQLVTMNLWNELNKTIQISEAICNSHQHWFSHLTRQESKLAYFPKWGTIPLNIHISQTWAYSDMTGVRIAVVTGGPCLHNRWLIYSMWSVTAAKLIPCASCPTHCTAENETPKSIAARRIVKQPALRATLWFPDTQNTFPFNFCEGLLWQSNKTRRSYGMKRSFIINRILAHIKVNDWRIVIQHCRGCKVHRG